MGSSARSTTLSGLAGASPMQLIENILAVAHEAGRLPDRLAIVSLLLFKSVQWTQQIFFAWSLPKKK